MPQRFSCYRIGSIEIDQALRMCITMCALRAACAVQHVEHDQCNLCAILQSISEGCRSVTDLLFDAKMPTTSLLCFEKLLIDCIFQVYLF